MAFPLGWPPRASTTLRSFRFFQRGTTTANFSDRAWMFSSAASANKALPYVKPGSLDPVDVPVNYGGGQDPHDGAFGNDPPPVPMFTPRFLYVFNDSLVLTDEIEISFDGVNVHGTVKGSTLLIMEDIREGGISVRTRPTCGHCLFRIQAW